MNNRESGRILIPRLSNNSRNNLKHMKNETNREEFKVSGDEIVKKVKELIQEGNARRIIIKSEEGKTMLEVPLTLGAVGALIAPVLAAVGALAALVAKCTIVVEKQNEQK